VKHVLLALAVLVLVGSSASALTVSYEDTIDWTDTHWADTMDFTQWDPLAYAGYELVSVEIALDGVVYNEADWALTAGTNATFEAHVNATIGAYRTWGDNGLLVQTLPSGSISHGPFAAPQGDFETVMGTSLPNLYNTMLTGDLSAFTGGGTVGILVDATGTQGYSINGTNAAGTCAFYTTQAGAHAKVTYTYESNIPEPATTGLFLMGLVGLAVARRRRSA
jgi:hypothetical protein